MSREQAVEMIQEDEKWIQMLQIVDRGHLTPVIEIRQQELRLKKGLLGIQ